MEYLIFGESHGPAIGVTLSGVPAGLALDLEAVQAQLDRRAPGKGDDVSFSVTRLDEDQGVAIGIITRIIKQNL